MNETPIPAREIRVGDMIRFPERHATALEVSSVRIMQGGERFGAFPGSVRVEAGWGTSYLEPDEIVYRQEN